MINQKGDLNIIAELEQAVYCNSINANPNSKKLKLIFDFNTNKIKLKERE